MAWQALGGLSCHLILCACWRRGGRRPLRWRCSRRGDARQPRLAVRRRRWMRLTCSSTSACTAACSHRPSARHATAAALPHCRACHHAVRLAAEVSFVHTNFLPSRTLYHPRQRSPLLSGNGHHRATRLRVNGQSAGFPGGKQKVLASILLRWRPTFVYRADNLPVCEAFAIRFENVCFFFPSPSPCKWWCESTRSVCVDA